VVGLVLVDADPRSARERLRRELQADLARLAGDGTLEWATKSGHFVHHDEPVLVVAAIRALVLSAR
jgi:pimeloyl-ACP methyl ester carboxylesterase